YYGLLNDVANIHPCTLSLQTLFRSRQRMRKGGGLKLHLDLPPADVDDIPLGAGIKLPEWDYRKQRLQDDFVNLQMMLPRGSEPKDRKSTRLNSSHVKISYAVFCLKK